MLAAKEEVEGELFGLTPRYIPSKALAAVHSCCARKLRASTSCTQLIVPRYLEIRDRDPPIQEARALPSSHPSGSPTPVADPPIFRHSVGLRGPRPGLHVMKHLDFATTATFPTLACCQLFPCPSCVSVPLQTSPCTLLFDVRLGHNLRCPVPSHAMLWDARLG